MSEEGDTPVIRYQVYHCGVVVAAEREGMPTGASGVTVHQQLGMKRVNMKWDQVIKPPDLSPLIHPQNFVQFCETASLTIQKPKTSSWEEMHSKVKIMFVT